MKLGVLGGTFDPIHNAHLLMADEVRRRLGLGEVLFVPAGQPWLKSREHSVTPVEHRVQMVRLAIRRRRYFALSPIELERPGPSYTVDTIAELKRQIGADDEIYFIMGCDSLAGLSRWREPARLVQLCRLVAVPRPGCPTPDLAALETQVPGLKGRVLIMDGPKIDISSSVIRERVAQGLSIKDLVPAAVEKYIKENRLYQASS